MILQGLDRGELCAQIEKWTGRNKYKLFWPRRAWTHESFRTVEGAKARVESVIHNRPIEWKAKET